MHLLILLGSVAVILGLAAAPAPAPGAALPGQDGQGVDAQGQLQLLATIPVGHDPQAIAVDPLARRVYVANAGDATVSVIDAAANCALATIPVGREPRAIAVDPTRHRIYVANAGAASISVLDGVTDRIVATVATGERPSALAVDPDAHVVYIADDGSRADHIHDPHVRTLDEAADRIVAAATVLADPGENVAAEVDATAIDTATHRLFIAAHQASHSWVAARAGLTPDATQGGGNLAFPLDGVAYALAHDGATRRLLVAESPGLVESVAAAGGSAPRREGVIQPCGDNSCGLAIAADPGIGLVYAARAGTTRSAPPPVRPALVVADERGAIVATATIGASPSAVALDPATHTLYVADANNNVTAWRGVGAAPTSLPALPAMPRSGGGGASARR